MDSSWIDFTKELPQGNTWVEAIHIHLGVIEYFYLQGRFTYWRYITHSIFNPEEVYILELTRD